MPQTWPDLDGIALAPTLTTLHLWSQVVGKVRLMLTPWENHGWHVPLYISARGLETGLIPIPGRGLNLEIDLVDERLRLEVTDGRNRLVALQPGSMADFLARVTDALGALGVEVSLNAMPAEIADATRFDQDHAHRDFDGEVARTYWRALVEVHRVFQLFRTRFQGKCSRVHLFWGAFDLAVTRFSGRVAPRHPGGAPHMPNAVAREAYSHEVSSAGFWPNLEGDGGPCFYAYAYPAPAGFDAQLVRPAAARFDPALGEFALPYSAVASSPDPDAALLDFLQSTYEAAADLARWDRAGLERPQGRLGQPPEGS